MSATLANGQCELRADTDDALVIGDGTDYEWSNDGPTWWAAAEVRTTDQARTNTDGYTIGRDLLGKHTTTLQVMLLGDSESDVGDRIDAWKAACARSADNLVVVRMNVLGRTRRRYGRFRIVGEADASETRTGWMAIGSAQFEALDARTYGDDARAATTTRTLPGIGIIPPFTPPFTLPASNAGTIVISNDGNATAPWIAHLTGPLTYPEIVHLESGRRLSLDFSANGGVVLASGDTLDLDSAERSVLLNGTADRRTQLSIDSQWWELDRGVNTFQLNADAGSGLLTVTARDAFYS